MITFEDAQQIVLDDQNDPEWVVAPWGWENDEFFVVVAGTPVDVFGPSSPEEARLLSRDDAPARLVDKATGEYRKVFGLMGEPAAPDLSPIGDTPVEDFVVVDPED